VTPTFTPCDPRCPAVTGKPVNDVRYCPMASPEARRRHREMPLIGGESPRKLRHPPAPGQPPWRGEPIRDAEGRSVWVILDWRDGQDKPVRVVPAPPDEDGTPRVRFEHDVPRHPDYTSCCADFRCCSDKFDAAGLGGVRDALISGAETVAVAKVDEGYVVLNTPPTVEDL
jgi:hypothetical protein